MSAGKTLDVGLVGDLSEAISRLNGCGKKALVRLGGLLDMNSRC
jgi:hypothetical protein